MKILINPQWTSICKETNKYNILTDSNYIINRGIIETMFKYLQHDNVEIDMILPLCNMLNNDFSEFDEIFKNDKVKLINIDFYPSAFSNRFDFPFKEINNKIDMTKYDVLLNHVPPITKNFRALQEIQGAKDLKIISFLHFLDDLTDKVPASISYFIRQWEGMSSSDIGIFQCEANMNKYMELARRFYHVAVHEDVNEIMKKKFRVWNCTYSQKEIDKYKSDEKYDVKSIVFPNRISNTNYNHFKEFIEAIDNIWKNRQDFQVLLTNPTNNLENKLYEQKKYLAFSNKVVLNREKYIEYISKCHIYVALFNTEYHGGVAARECGAAGVLPVFPRINEYAKLMSPDYPGYCKKDLSDLEEKINTMLDLVDNKIDGNNYRAYAYRSIHKVQVHLRDSFENNGHKIISTISELIEDKK